MNELTIVDGIGVLHRIAPWRSYGDRAGEVRHARVGMGPGKVVVEPGVVRVVEIVRTVGVCWEKKELYCYKFLL